MNFANKFCEQNRIIRKNNNLKKKKKYLTNRKNRWEKTTKRTFFKQDFVSFLQHPLHVSLLCVFFFIPCPNWKQRFIPFFLQNRNNKPQQKKKINSLHSRLPLFCSVSYLRAKSREKNSILSVHTKNTQSRRKWISNRSIFTRTILLVISPILFHSFTEWITHPSIPYFTLYFIDSRREDTGEFYS